MIVTVTIRRSETTIDGDLDTVFNGEPVVVRFVDAYADEKYGSKSTQKLNIEYFNSTVLDNMRDLISLAKAADKRYLGVITKSSWGSYEITMTTDHGLPVAA